MIAALALVLAIEGPRVASTPIVIDGDLPEAWRGRLSAALDRGLRDLDVQPLTVDTTCDDACRSARAAAEARELVVVPQLVADGNLFDLEMRVLTADGELVARRSEACKPCGRADVEALVERQAASIGDWIRATPSDHVLEIEAATPGASVLVDGRVAGEAPLALHLPEGEHVISVRAPGHAARRRTIAAVRGVTERWTVTLDPEPRPAARDRLWPAGWIAIATGTASLAAGATLLALHHRPYRLECDGADYDARNDVCRQRYATLPHGAVLTALGSAAIATGIVLAVAGHRRRHPRRLETAASLGRGGATAWIGGSF